jgi:hypothetical protein
VFFFDSRKRERERERERERDKREERREKREERREIKLARYYISTLHVIPHYILDETYFELDTVLS